MDQFLNILFLIQPGKMWNVPWSNLKNHKKHLKTCCTLVSNVGATMHFPSQNRLDLQTRGHFYSISATIVIINEGMDGNFK